MAEFDSVTITNPTSEDFTWNYNGEPYTIGKGETKAFSKHVGFHLAKHLSSKMVDEVYSEKNKKFLHGNAQQDPRVRAAQAELAQLMVFDNPKRRIALYQICGDEKIAEEVIKSYPFKGFIGDMKEYVDFVEKSKSSDKSVAAKAA